VHKPMRVANGVVGSQKGGNCGVPHHLGVGKGMFLYRAFS
jgi:hypothetical protein